MAKLDLRIINRNNQTHTVIGKKGVTDDIVFHNDSNADLRVDFVPTNVIQDHSGVIPGFTVKAQVKKAVSFVAGCKVGDTVKYTATINGTAPEDPIIIIER